MDRKQVSSRESLAMQKRRIATSGTHELTDTTPRADAIVECLYPMQRFSDLGCDGLSCDRHLQNMSLDRNGI